MQHVNRHTGEGRVQLKIGTAKILSELSERRSTKDLATNSSSAAWGHVDVREATYLRVGESAEII